MEFENCIGSFDEDEYLDRLISSTEFLINSVESNVEIYAPEETYVVPKENAVPFSKKRKLCERYEMSSDDIRSTYARDYINSLNNADSDEYDANLRKIAVPHMLFVMKHNNPNSVMPRNMEVIGIDAIVKVVESFFFAVPDVVCSIVSEKAYLHEDGESSIGCIFQISGSKMYKINGLGESTEDKVVVHNATNAVGRKNNIVVNIEQKANDDVYSVPLQLGEAQARKNFSLRYTLTMHLNVDKKVFQIVLSSE